MADISKIKTLDGTTYNIKDATARSSIPAAATANPVMDGTAAVGSSTKYAREDHKHPTDTSRAAASHTHLVTDVTQGNASVAAGLDPVTQSLIGSAASNKSFGLPANAITIEYSTNGGSTWTNYGATDDQKRSLFAETRSFNAYLGKASSAANNSINNQLRITIEPLDRYVSFNGVYIWMSTSGNTVVFDLERSTIGAKDTFTTVFTGQSIAGWSGNNIRYFSYGSFGGGSTQTGNQYKYRLIFKQTAINSSYGSASIQDIRFIGSNVWSSPNNIVSKNHLYTWDIDLNATFPAKVTASSFSGNLTGNSTGVSTTGSATNSTARHVWFSDSSDETKRAYSDNLKYTPSTNTISANVSGSVNGHTVNADVPSGAKFTDTTYTANTSKLATTTVPNVTSVGSAPTLGTAIPADDITAWNAGSTPTLGTAIPADDITAWTANTPTSASVSNGVLTIATGTAASLSYTAKSIPNVTSVGSVPSLSYTAKSIPNVTSVGSAPTLGTAITVATGSLAANGGGGTVATGITAS